MSEALKNKIGPIPFIDLGAQQHRIRNKIELAIKRVLNHGSYILGPEVEVLEEKLSKFTGSKHVITCANGTDALLLALMALGITEGDAVFCPSFTFAATAEPISLLGATPIFVDVSEETFNIDPACLVNDIDKAKRRGLRIRAVIAVDLFGVPANYDSLNQICLENDLELIADAAQSFGATYKNRKIGKLAKVSTTSFFPSKPLGCYGDGGALFTDDDKIASDIRSLRIHGKGANKYDNVRIGLNSRLDTLQASILLEKLKIFPEELEKRNRVSDRYNHLLSKYVTIPNFGTDLESAWALYTIRVPADRRNHIIDCLKEAGIPAMIYYPKPLHKQIAFSGSRVEKQNLPVCERLSDEVISLPMHPYLEKSQQDYICKILISLL